MVNTFEKVVIIDGKDHMMGRLASITAKHLLEGQDIVVVRCEDLCISGSLARNKLLHSHYLRKRCLVNPKKGPFHFRAPSKIFHKAVRGMVPRFTKRGEQALSRLTVVEGIPPKYQVLKKMIVPQAYRQLRLRQNRKFCTVGELANTVGWKYGAVVDKLEAKRKTRDAAWYAAQLKKKQSVKTNEKVKKLQAELSKYGF
eukprot:NODE_22_length_38364_cov_0.248661.p17 type:complete len:199 gc:universal NODE_22_length_38364_cov_0.248661:26724-26128(-)